MNAISYDYLFRGSNKARLLGIVAELCEELGRPVCSRDLNAYYQRQPESRPDLLKRTGQVLLAAARARHGHTPRLISYGVFGNHAYYGHKDCPELAFGFLRERTQAELRSLCESPRLDDLWMHREHPTCRAALGGFAREISVLLARDVRLRHLRTPAVDACWKRTEPFLAEWNPVSITNWMTRNTAHRWLRREAFRRRGIPNVSTARWLSTLAWPQSAIWPRPSRPGFWAYQLGCFARARWPSETDDPCLQRALFHAARFACCTPNHHQP